MTLRITLLRHGHADDASEDFQRPLSSAGRGAVLQSARSLRESGACFDLVLTSAAPRAQRSAELVAEALGHVGALLSDRSLYLATGAGLLARLRELPQSVRSVLLVGHNPGLSELAARLTGSALSLRPADFVVATPGLDDWSSLPR
jgi:phosphohistidine phosphatase